MSDLIDRNDAVEAIEFEKVYMTAYKGNSNGYVSEGNPLKQYNKGLDDAIKAVNNLAPAEPERKKGKWIDEKINSYTSRTYCSECGKSAPFIYKSDDHYGNHAHGEDVRTNFCPNCGADMRGEYE